MNTEIIRTFALIYGAVIALICAIYVALIMRKERKMAEQAPLEEEQHLLE